MSEGLKPSLPPGILVRRRTAGAAAAASRHGAAENCRGARRQPPLPPCPSPPENGGGYSPLRARQALLQDHAHLTPPERPSHVADEETPGQAESRMRASTARFALRPQPAARPVECAAHHGPARLPAPLRPGRRCRPRRRQLTLVKKAGPPTTATPPSAPARSRSSARCARTARWAARSMRWSRTASGCARSRCSTRPSTWARTAPRAPRCASTATANTACATR
jgi:hypothetical protein